MAEERFNGTIVTWFGDRKNFGFVRPDYDGTDGFVHKARCGVDDLRVGDRVSFSVIPRGPAGRWEAIELEILKRTSQ